MTIPASYTAPALATWLTTQVYDFGKFLLPTSGSKTTVAAVIEANVVDNVVMAYGKTDIADCDDIKKLRLLGRIEVWKAICSSLALNEGFSDGESTYYAPEAYEIALKNLRQAEADGMQYTASYAITSGKLIWKDDPYTRTDLGDL